jgi:hypothetical protein
MESQVYDSEVSAKPGPNHPERFFQRLLTQGIIRPAHRVQAGRFTCRVHAAKGR